MSLNFAIIGVGGYVAPRHLAAIKSLHGNVVAALDPHDSVGILDQYFPSSAFFTEFERFDRHIERLKREGTPIHYLCICSPNYLHDAHIRFGIRIGAQVICEKPLTLNPWNLDALNDLSKKGQIKINTILQLRLHPEALRLKEYCDSLEEKVEVDLSYITPRGKWYYASWKGDESKSGGITTNIGIHLFDLLLWLFGSVKEVELYRRDHDCASGYLEFNKARVKWFLSTNSEYLKDQEKKRTYRVLRIANEKFDFSYGFEKLHEKSYQQILNNQGFDCDDARPAIELCSKLRTMNIAPKNMERSHELLKLGPFPHPFSNQSNINT